jgi:predicted TIM-barrel fold metal-dependent hydrolase
MAVTETKTSTLAEHFGGLKVIDTDAHWSEPHDLWTARAPAAYRDLVPQLKEHRGKRKWVVNGDIPIAGDSATSAIGPDGDKLLGLQFLKLDIGMVHAASSQMGPRLEVMDQLGLHTQILYPNVAGFGNQNFMKVEDAALRIACVEIYNDYMAELQSDSAERLLPMALVPWWDIEATVAEITRCADLGFRGIVMCSNPHDSGAPEFIDPAWEPFWEACESLGMPINFHIGSSQGDMDWFGRVPYSSWPGEVKITIGGANIFMGQARWMSNLLLSDIPENHPTLKFVSVESGVGWIPFLLEALDYQAGETAPERLKHLSMTPSEYFRRQFYGCFWFESHGVQPAVDYLGATQVMFETDFPHPTCLYPRSLERTEKTIGALAPDVQRRILQDNAAELYRIDV